MFTLKKTIFAGIISLLGMGEALASGPKLIGEYKDWIAYYYDDPRGTVYYIASTPKKDEGKYTRRGDIYVVVTHRPAEDSFDVVNFVAGYDYKAGAPVEIKIGTTTITDLFTEGDKAWTLNSSVDKELVSEMKKGQRMIVKGVSSKGTVTKDTYSLSGFMSAYRAINAKCKR